MVHLSMSLENILKSKAHRNDLLTSAYRFGSQKCLSILHLKEQVFRQFLIKSPRCHSKPHKVKPLYLIKIKSFYLNCNWKIETFPNTYPNDFAPAFQKCHAGKGLNSRQEKVIQKLLELYPNGFEGGLTNRIYVSITQTSPESAKRNLKALLDKGLILQNEGGGRSVSYRLNEQIHEE